MKDFKTGLSEQGLVYKEKYSHLRMEHILMCEHIRCVWGQGWWEEEVGRVSRQVGVSTLGLVGSEDES